MEIKNITKDIKELDTKLVEHQTKLQDMRSDIISNIEKESNKLEICINKNNIENRKTSELQSTLSKLRLSITNYENKIKSLEIKEKSIQIDESKITDTKNELISLQESKENKLNELEIIKTEIRQNRLTEEGTKENIDKLNSEIKTLSNSKNKLNSEIIDFRNKSNTLEKRIKYLNDEESRNSESLKAIKINADAVKIEYNSYKDRIVTAEGKIGQINVTKNNLLGEKIKINTEIKELNEIKDNITHVIATERSKGRNDENKILAIKKEVIKFIMDNKDMGNRKQLAKFAKEVENA